MKYFGAFCIVVAVLIGFFVVIHERRNSANTGNGAASPSLITKRSLKIGENTLNVEIADTGAKRERGLSYRKSLGENEGMLFVFDKEDERVFWMKDMNFPIDIAWIDKNMKIIHIEHGVSPATYPNTFTSPTPAQYVLETNAQYFSKSNIKIGETIKF